MTEAPNVDGAAEAPLNRRLAILLSMAMFVLVVDTSIMNVSISAVVDGPGYDGERRPVRDRPGGAGLCCVHPDRQQGRGPDRTQARLRARAVRLRGRRDRDDARPEPDGRDHLLGDHRRASGPRCCCRLCSRSSTATSRVWPRRRSTPWSAPRQRSPPPSGRCSAGFITTYLSWRVAFGLEVVVIAVVLSGIKLRPRRALHRSATGRRGRLDPVRGRDGRRGARHPGVAGRRRGRRRRSCCSAQPHSAGSSTGCDAASAQGKATLLDPDLFRSKLFRFGVSGQLLQQIALGGTMIVLPIYLQMVLEYNAMQAGLSLAPLSLTMFAVALLAGKRAGKRRPASVIRIGFLGLLRRVSCC